MRKNKKNTRAVSLRLTIWKRNGEEVIQIVAPEYDGFVTSVNKKEGSVRCHSNLFSKFKKILLKNKYWHD